MKKRRLKKWVKEMLLIIIIFLIGFGCTIAIVERQEQIDRSMSYEKIN